MLEISVAEVYFLGGFDDESVVCSAPTCRIFIVFGIFVRVFFRIFRYFYRSFKCGSFYGSRDVSVAFRLVGPRLYAFHSFGDGVFIELHRTQVALSAPESQPHFLFTGGKDESVSFVHILGKQFKLMVTVSAGHGHFVERDSFFRRGSGTEDYNLLLVIAAPSMGELHSGGFVVCSVCTEIHFPQTDDGFRRSVPDAAVTYIETRIFD